MGLNEKLFVKAVIDLSLPDEVNMNSRYFYTHDHTVQSLFEEFIAPIDIHVPSHHATPLPYITTIATTTNTNPLLH